MSMTVQEPDRFMREPEVCYTTGLSRTTRWRLEREGKFPQRRRISANAVGWLASEIHHWIKAQLDANAAPGSD